MAGPTPVQAVRNQGSGAAASVTFAASRAGTLLALAISAGQGSGANPTFSLPAGWVSAGAALTQNGWNPRTGQLWYYPNNPGGITSVAVTISAAVGGWVIQAAEFSSVATASPLDVAGQTAPGVFETSAAQSLTTTADGDLIVGWAAANASHGGASISGPASGWTNEPTEADAAGFENDLLSWQVQATHGAVSYTATSTASTDWMIAAVAFKAASSGPTTPPAVMHFPRRAFATIQ